MSNFVIVILINLFELFLNLNLYRLAIFKLILFDFYKLALNTIAIYTVLIKTQ